MQGVTKLISTFFSFCDLKLKLCQLSLQKMGLNLHYQEVKSFSKRDEKKSNTLQKSLFSHYFYKKKKHLSFGTQCFKLFLNDVQNLKKIKLININIKYWLVNFFDHTNIPNFH